MSTVWGKMEAERDGWKARYSGKEWREAAWCACVRDQTCGPLDRGEYWGILLKYSAAFIGKKGLSCRNNRNRAVIGFWFPVISPFQEEC